MASVIRWGILDTGRVAQVFAEDLLRLPGHEVAAVGSPSQDTADAFARAHGVERAYGSYPELAADDALDVVYVTSPPEDHLADASLCLDAGRAVLVEKPFTASTADAERLITLARDRGLFAMEAMTTRFNPLIARLRTLVADGAVGQVASVHADLGVVAVAHPPAHRNASPGAGGALLDLGVFPLSLAWMLLGAPDTVQATAATAPTGVDVNTGILLGYASGAVALLHCNHVAASPQTATVTGTTGRIDVAAPFHRPDRMTLHRGDAEPETFGIEVRGSGFSDQAEEVARRLLAGEPESPIMPLEESLGIHRTLDTIMAGLQRVGPAAAREKP